MTQDVAESAQAIIENDCIVIRVPIDYLPMILEGGWACNAFPSRMKVTDGAVLAKEIAYELNHEDEEGSTPIHRLFDKAINAAIEAGAEGIDFHEGEPRDEIVDWSVPPEGDAP